jgi:hypothetical protein
LRNLEDLKLQMEIGLKEISLSISTSKYQSPKEGSEESYKEEEEWQSGIP